MLDRFLEKLQSAYRQRGRCGYVQDRSRRTARHFAGHAWGIDITARSVRFAEFSRRLNQIANATFLQGDLYRPCEGKQFDRIVTHPPYALGATSTYIYADGGEGGQTEDNGQEPAHDAAHR